MKTIHHHAPVRLLVLCAALGAGFAGAVRAEGITLYGVADIYAEFGKGDRNEVSLNSGGVSGSRLGFDASKDLGDGLKAIAKLEAGYALDHGSSTQGGLLFGRQAYAGVSGSFGTLTAGRQYTPQFIALDTNDPFDTGAGSAVSSGIVSLFASRANNSVVWASPTTGGFSATAMLAAGESATGSQTNSSLAFLDLHYGSGGSGVNLTFSGQKKSVDAGVNATAVTLGGTWDFGAAKLMGGVQLVNNSTGAADTEDNRHEFFAGVNVPIGADTLWLGAGTGKTVHVAGTTASQYSVGYIHNVAKGVDVYGVLTSIKNGAATAYSDDTATGAGPAVSAGKTASAAQLGFRYRF
ncbi:MAG: porin [Betaproteobacteria bacterium]